DLGVSGDHPTGSPARVPLGTLPSQALGAISDHLLWPPASSRFDEPDRLIDGRPACSGDVPPHPCRRRPAPSRSPCPTSRQDPRRREEPHPASKIGKDWPVKSPWGTFV